MTLFTIKENKIETEFVPSFPSHSSEQVKEIYDDYFGKDNWFYNYREAFIALKNRKKED